jgi:Activator of Hsp90 ATPase homolog 1-like protein
MLQDYKCTVNAKVSAEEAYRKVARVSDWWNQRSTGKTQMIGDTFRVNFGETWVDFEVVEAVPNKRFVWHVTDCHLHSFEDRTEWKDTSVIWDLTTANDTTTVTMAHAGLTPAVECFKAFKAFKAGWNFHVGESLLKLLTEDRGLPDHGRKTNA